MNVIPKDEYNKLLPKIKENKVCLQCWREFKKPIKTTFRNNDKYSSGYGKYYTTCQKCINAINNCNWC